MQYRLDQRRGDGKNQIAVLRGGGDGFGGVVVRRVKAISLSTRLVVFTLDDCRYGLPLEFVDRVVRIVEVTPLPKAPDIVLGIVNVQGRVIAVADLRKRFRLSERKPLLSDQLIIARTPHRPVALVVDAVSAVAEYAEGQAAAAQAIVSGTDYIAGVAKLADGMVLIQDLGRLLSLDEERDLEEAMPHA
jgi:purine-binding chemotaxis protein CheW